MEEKIAQHLAGFEPMTSRVLLRRRALPLGYNRSLAAFELENKRKSEDHRFAPGLGNLTKNY